MEEKGGERKSDEFVFCLGLTPEDDADGRTSPPRRRFAGAVMFRGRGGKGERKRQEEVTALWRGSCLPSRVLRADLGAVGRFRLAPRALAKR